MKAMSFLKGMKAVNIVGVVLLSLWVLSGCGNSSPVQSSLDNGGVTNNSDPAVDDSDPAAGDSDPAAGDSDSDSDDSDSDSDDSDSDSDDSDSDDDDSDSDDDDSDSDDDDSDSDDDDSDSDDDDSDSDDDDSDPVVVAPTDQVKISGNMIFDQHGAQVVARGPEKVMASSEALDTIDTIAAKGANAMRMLLCLDAANGTTPVIFESLLDRAINTHNMLVWVSLFTWDDSSNFEVSEALGGGNFYELESSDGLPECTESAPATCYLAVWDRQWLFDLMYTYRSNIIIDAGQEFINPNGGGHSQTPEGRALWAQSAMTSIQWFRQRGYTQPLEIMSNFEGRDLYAIVEHGDEIRNADNVLFDGEPQTLFGWQAYWSGDWYPGWQGELIIGPGESLSGAQAIHQVLPTLDFPVQVGFDNYPGDTNIQYVEQINQAAIDDISWLWWAWQGEGADSHVECPMSGQECIDFVEDSSNGFAGATPLSDGSFD